MDGHILESPLMSTRSHARFTPHVKIDLASPADRGKPVTNLIHKSDDPSQQWIVKATENIGEWRSLARDTYIRWALAINGMCKCEEVYADFPDHKRFQIATMRARGGHVGSAIIAEWTGAETVDAYKKSVSFLASHGVTDLYGCLEEIIFALYVIFLRENPNFLMQGKEFKDLRRLRSQAEENSKKRPEYERAFEQRLEDWRRKRAYDGLAKVFLAFVTQSRIKKPHWYVHSDPSTWAAIIELISELRNLIVHGDGAVSQRLAKLSKENEAFGWDFEAETPLIVLLHHMMTIECFIDQLLNALNASLIELANGKDESLKFILG